jgi:hypothetical protein
MQGDDGTAGNVALAVGAVGKQNLTPVSLRLHGSNMCFNLAKFSGTEGESQILQNIHSAQHPYMIGERRCWQSQAFS